MLIVFFFQAEDGIRDDLVTGVQTCALPISWIHFDEIAAAAVGILQELDRAGVAIVRGAADGERRGARSEERRVGKECRSRGSAEHEKKKRRKTKDGGWW